METLRHIADRYDTDKRTKHSFILWYEQALEPIRQRARAVLEIGVYKGESLRMWRDYFPNARIHGMDNDPRRIVREDRIDTFIGDQGDQQGQESLAMSFSVGWDLIIDDGSHLLVDQERSCKVWLPRLVYGGLYIIEDAVYITPSESEWKPGIAKHWHEHEQWLKELFNVGYGFVSFSPSRYHDDHLIVIRKWW